MGATKPSHLKSKRNSIGGKSLAIEKEIYLVSFAIKEEALVLGTLKGQTFVPNARGQIVLDCWQDLSRIRSDLHPDAVRIGPRHLQGLLILTSTEEDPLSLNDAVRLIKVYTALRLARKSAKKAPLWKNGYSERLIASPTELRAARQALKSPVSE
jgi:hypothetical protein